MIDDSRRNSVSKRKQPSSESRRWASESGWFVAVTLIVSGLAHLSLLQVTRSSWEGAVSLRKPGLFGISAGLTAASLLWCSKIICSNRRHALLAPTIAWSLFIEVALITMQYWRGVPSHFNRATFFDAVVEGIMVALILWVTVGIAWMCWTSLNAVEADAGRLLAIRAGLFFLLASCLLGVTTMICGEYNLRLGRPAEIWGQSGILKYPHGAVLHAIQVLPFFNWGLTKLDVPRRVELLKLGVTAHLTFMFHALWQTCTGRSRLDVDLFGGTLLGASCIMLMIPLLCILAQGIRRIFTRTIADGVHGSF